MGDDERGSSPQRQYQHHHQYHRAPPHRGRGREDDYHISDRYRNNEPGHRQWDDDQSSDPYVAYSEFEIHEAPRIPPESSGDGDVSADEEPLQFLLIRDMPVKVDELLLRKGIEKLYREDSGSASASAQQTRPTASGATPGSLKRVFIIRDRLTNKSMKFGFAEFHSVNDAAAALNKAKGLERYTIASSLVTMCFPHAGVFVPVVPEQSNDNTRFLFEMNGQLWKYRDGRYFASSQIANAEPPSLPTASSQVGEAEVKTAKKRTIESQGATLLDSQGQGQIKKPKMDASFGLAQKWSKKTAELRGENGGDDDDESSQCDPEPASQADQDTGKSLEQPETFVFVGMRDGKKRRSCLLCGTNLKEEVAVTDHVKRSARHNGFVKDPKKYSEGVDRLNSWLREGESTFKLSPDRQEATEKPIYRDRAKERRQEEAATRIKVSLKPGQRSSSLSQDEPASEETTMAPYSKGLNMLQRAGWKEGQALGTGSGLTAPIEQNMYAIGVGLGHEGSKKGDAIEEAARLTKDDRGSFIEKTKQVARERFQKLN